MKYLKLLITLILCNIFILNFSFAQEIQGSLKIATAPNISANIVYEDNVFGKLDYKFYKIHLDVDRKVILKLDVKPGTVNQAITYEFMNDTTGYEIINQNDFMGNEVYETHFEDSFDVVSGNYLLKISRYSGRFLEDYSFEITFGCPDNKFSKNSSWECISGVWVEKNIKPVIKEVVVVEEETSEEDLCNGCFVDDKCYDIGYIVNETFCSNRSNPFLKQFAEDKSCSSDYQCKYGECNKGECNGLGFFARLMAFFKDLF